MDKQDIRRENLRKWVIKHGTPQAEKSYFSQLLGGASFGEKAARRLEATYRMGAGYLDRQENVPALDNVVSNQARDTDVDFALDKMIELMVLYRQASQAGKDFILSSARMAEQADGDIWVKPNQR